jgi:hypothetical protein
MIERRDHHAALVRLDEHHAGTDDAEHSRQYDGDEDHRAQPFHTLTAPGACDGQDHQTDGDSPNDKRKEPDDRCNVHSSSSKILLVIIPVVPSPET